MDKSADLSPSNTKAIVFLSVWMTVVTLALTWGVIRVWPMASKAMSAEAKAELQESPAANPGGKLSEPVQSPSQSAPSDGATPPPAAPEAPILQAADRATKAAAEAVKAATQAKEAAKQAAESSALATKRSMDSMPLGEKGSILVLILLLGAAGAQIHALQSFSDFVGNGSFASRWMFWYMKRPIIGGLLALTVYAVIGGGVMGLDAAMGKAGGNLWGLAAICLLSGMFSRLVTDKLYEVFATLLAVKPQDKIPRNDGMTEDPPAPKPVLTRLDPATVSLANPIVVKITGKNFTAKCRVQVGDTIQETFFKSTTELELPAASLPTKPGKYGVVVIDGGTKAGSPATVELEVTV